MTNLPVYDANALTAIHWHAGVVAASVRCTAKRSHVGLVVAYRTRKPLVTNLRKRGVHPQNCDLLCPDRREWDNKRCFCPSVRLSVRGVHSE